MKNVTDKFNVGKEVQAFIDSGAYSAFTQRKTIDINEYIEFIKRNIDSISVYANLDVIGDTKATWHNQQIMEKAGLHPLPVFHMNEEMSYFHRYLEDYDFIALGGMVGVSTNKLIKWLDTLFQIICDTPDKMPKCKVHGFGMTSFKVLLRYPFYSVDSTTFVKVGRHGAILVPPYKNGKWVYTEPPRRIDVSNWILSKNEAGKHITTLSPMKKATLLNYIHKKGYKLGVSEFKMVDQSYKLADNEIRIGGKPNDKNQLMKVEVIIKPGISNTMSLRDDLNIDYFLDLEANLPDWPRPFKL